MRPAILLVRVVVAIGISMAPAALILLVSTPVQAQARLAAAAEADGIRPGDMVRLRIWREDGLSGEFTVDQEGVVVLPKIGAMAVTGMRPGELRERLIEEYATSLNHTSIEVTLLRRIQILGAVRDPGLYPVDATLTVSDAIALAGGVTANGRPDNIELRRFGTFIEDVSIRDQVASSPIRSGDQLYVPERSWISRNPGFLAGIIGATVSVVIALAN